MRQVNIAAVVLVALAGPPTLADSGEESTLTFGSHGFSANYNKPPRYSALQLRKREEHRKSDMNILCQRAEQLHPGAATKAQVERAYVDFESSLQKAADELATTEPFKSAWATELITFYTRPTHKWPAVSPTLDRAVAARELLVRFTNEDTVSAIEKKLYRFATPADKTHYHFSPDLRPGVPYLRRQ